MAKKLIVLSDGTGNSAAKLFKTNVWKLYEALDLTPSSDQIALYDDGVGTSRFRPWALLTGAFGFGLKRNVLKMYVFLSRHYHNEIEAQQRASPGVSPVPPEIYGFGFSRGAFTIRVLAGLVIRQGLVPHASEAEMIRMALLNYRAYRKKCFHTKTGIEKPFRNLRDAIAKLVDRVCHRPEYDPNRKTEDGKPNAVGVRMNTGGVKIRFLGLWDTVAAYGMPIEELRVAIDKLVFPLTFTTTNLLKDVQIARHALSIDDERSSFAPLLWDHEKDDRLKQVWFAGVHTSVGGGYPDDSLSSAPLAWMVFNAKDEGLQFHQHALDDIRGRATPFGKMYDSRSGFGSFYRYQPRHVRCQIDGKTAPAPPIVHESVVFRMATGFQGYAPIALPQEVEVVDRDGQIHRFAGFQQIAVQGLDRFETMAATQDIRLAEMVASLQPPKDTDLIEAAVFRRRVAYFGTLIPVLALAAFPVLGRMFPQPPRLDAGWVQTLGEVGKFVASITPWYLAPWQSAIAQNAVVAAILVALAILFYWRGSVLKLRIADRARAAWSIGHNRQPATLRQSFADTIALKLVRSPRAKATWAFSAGKLFPAFAMLLAVLVPTIMLDRTVFWLKYTSGKICTSHIPYEKLRPVTGKWQEISFKADDPCMTTEYRLRKGHRYELLLQLPHNGQWNDAGNEADWTGLDFSKLSWGQALAMHLGASARRKLGEPWFAPIARVGMYGSEEYALTPADVVEGQKPRETMTSVIVPLKNGELFLFVNDAYSGLFPLAWLEPTARRKSGWSARHLYGNNFGTAKVSIRREDGEND